MDASLKTNRLVLQNISSPCKSRMAHRDVGADRPQAVIEPGPEARYDATNGHSRCSPARGKADAGTERRHRKLERFSAHGNCARSAQADGRCILSAQGERGKLAA